MNKFEASATVAFTRDAEEYDELRRRLIPCFSEFYGTALKLIQEWQTASTIDVLDIGAGTGLFSAMVLAQCPVRRLCLLDGSAGMLERARNRFLQDDRLEYSLADIAHSNLGGPWDLIISALAIHHLLDCEKRDVYQRISLALKPGGLFVNAEQVAGPGPMADERYSRIWFEEIRQLGVSEEDINKTRERMSFDKCATVGSQLQWLLDAGFTDVDCSFKAWRFAVLSGRA